MYLTDVLERIVSGRT
ncbi:hypothetical protein, partial [Bradyrhizobium sp. UFLA06-06]